ncbi:MAG: DNA translocase FtsK [Clostridia bacterium]|nr:DNA translocase FtsK [Clostridia bacterium]
MPNQKKTNSQSSTKKNVKPTSKQNAKKKRTDKDSSPLKTRVAIASFWILALLCTIFFIANLFDGTGPLVRGFCTVIYGLFGYGALLIVPVFILYAIEWKSYDEEKTALYKVIFTTIGMLSVAVLFHLILILTGGLPEPKFSDFFKINAFWYDHGPVGGGVIGGLIAGLLFVLMHGWVALIFCLIILSTAIMLYFRETPVTLTRAFIRWCKKRKALNAKRKEAAEREAMKRKAQKKLAEKKAAEEAARLAAEQEEEDEEEYEEDEDEEEEDLDGPVAAGGIEFDFDEEEDEEPEPEPEDEDVPMIPIQIFSDRDPEPEPEPEPLQEVERSIYDFSDIPEVEDSLSGADNVDFGFGNDDDDIDLAALLEAGKQQAQEDMSAVLPDKEEADLTEEEGDILIPGITDAPAAPERKPYVFPPVTLLSPNENPKTEDDREELMRNARRLVEVLKSFRVDTEIVNISRGPTITRYELAPKVGVRVRAIANLVDDIALNLETSGVRIEAPIPGKAAVGVEVPNRSQATVYLRDLIESESFKNAKSKLTACVGMDVSGAPVLMDIAKMPHLLIAGATGMGKSVGVNSIIMSLLYKASPDELKLILVDPKKVELNMYNKLPHLLIPVVNNPKKAAGALATAVNEMERRFELIESVGVRDLKSYNALAENDPTKEKLPQIVIIIDELADLMMTAKDDVEDSICRIAQKARAAGIHLIICTQRPSVDVITGLIKANVPSRIAFTVASNIDSRTIIDVAGAEKLIGRGDMLFAPVGAMKPMRVQGAFVSDKEVEAVTDFIKSQTADVHYDDSFLNMVEVEAERCGQQKKKVSSDEIDADEDLDPKFYEAVEIAIDMGKISTSLLQRRLSLGYGRAAKIIDKMEQMGVVGPQEGQKPRNILISRQEYQEMIMGRSDG